eukprot:gene19892-biopygen7017
MGGREKRPGRTSTAVEFVAGRGTGVGEQAFENWAPQVLNKVHGTQNNDDGEPDESESEGDEAKKIGRKGRKPSDEFAALRKAYYGWLSDKFEGKRESFDTEGRVIVWTDGSSLGEGMDARAGAGIFYGEGNKQNVGTKVPGKQTSQRAELSAVLHVLQTEKRPVQIVGVWTML